MIKIQQTGDGSPTLYSSVYDASYHSRKGALRESLHVFIGNGIEKYLSTHPDKEEIHILEMGFGSGLNAFLSAQFSATHNFPIHYTGVEKHPVSLEKALDFIKVKSLEELDSYSLYSNIIKAEWDENVELNDFFSFRKCEADFLQLKDDKQYDIIFYDAFGPKRQAELWDEDACKNIYKRLKQNGILTTYCAQGQFKRNLKSCGFEVHALDGPPGKREMTYAVKK